MALTNAQKVAIRKWLGYSGRYFQTDTVLEQAMAAIADPDLEAEIATLLAELATVDARRATVRDTGGLKQVDEVVFQDGSISSLRAVLEEGSMLVARLAAMLGVDVRHNPFSTTASDRCGYMKQG